MSQTTLILVCHAPLATALHAVGCHAFAQGLGDVQTMDVMASATPADVAQQIQDLYIRCGQPAEVLLITDLQGATPANGVDAWRAQRVAAAGACPPALAGASLPLLLRAVTHRHLPAEALAQELAGCTRSNPCRMESPREP